MEDIELVIKIPKGLYKAIYNECMLPFDVKTVVNAITNGTPLPKGHGRLGDLDALREEVSSWGMNDYEPSDFTDEIDRTDTIIEADKENEDGND